MTSESSITRVLVGAAERLFAEAAARALDAHGHFDVVGIALTPENLIELASARIPDVVLLNVASCTGDSEAVVSSAAAASPTSAIVVIVADEVDECLFGALEAGACGYVTVTQSFEDVIDAVRAAATHEVVMSPHFARIMLERLRTMRASDRSSGRANTEAILTPREIDVLVLVAGGFANDAVARSMGVSASTVKNHLYSVYRKLGVSNRSQAVAEGYRRGILVHS